MDYSISSGLITHSKNFKMPFFRGISNSCHGVTVIGLEPLKRKFGEQISTILGARMHKLCYDPMFFTISSQTIANSENFKKISQTVFDLEPM